jgi:hypothetical protein
MSTRMSTDAKLSRPNLSEARGFRRFDQSAPWPIHLSEVRPWLVVFSGSSQWHYRDPIDPADGSALCTLLFMHFIARGTADLLDPRHRAALVGVPELAALARPAGNSRSAGAIAAGRIGPAQ